MCLVILGAGGHGQVVADVACQLGFYNKIVFLDDAAACAAGAKLAVIVHPTAYVSPRAKLSGGCSVLPHAIVNTDAVLGKGCIINIGAMVDHRTVLEDGVHLAPGAIVKGENHIAACTKVESGEVIAARSRV